MDLHLRRELHVAGYTDAEIRRACRAGSLRPVRRGAYLAGPDPDGDAPRHLVCVRAALAHLSGDAVVSHVSAAVVHGLPLWGVPLDRVHVTRARRRTGGRRGATVHVHSAPLDPDEVVVAGGTAVTAPVRTMLDVARTVPFEQAVVVVDAALRCGLVDAAALDEAVRSHPRWPGLPAARRAIAFADGRSQSPGESRSRVAIARARLPVPELQWRVHAAADGRFLGQVDFGWRHRRTVGEFDRRVKYGRLMQSDQDAGEAVYAEKLREDALRAEGLTVVRWCWADLDEFERVANRLRQWLHRT